MKKTNRKAPRSVAHSRAHIQKLHRVRLGLFGLLLLMLVAVRGNAGIVQVAAQEAQQGSVLAYSTSMSRTDLLNETNTFRTQNGLAPLTLNSQLNTSAQNKAQNMIDHDYWAHTAPDGTTPWYFFEQAGYSYTKAGENLAYGFNTSQDAVNGWIGSPGHRANMLGAYNDVGFGFADGANYQGGQNTVVVAHYGAPATPAAAPAPVSAVAPASTSVPQTPAPAAVAPTPPATAPTPTSVVPESKVTKPTKPITTPAVSVATIQNVSLLDQLGTKQPQLVAVLGVLLVVSIVAGFALTHRSYVRHAAIVGERFIIAHPILDSTVIVAIIGLILSTTVGRIG